eukprot:TRINITY_DN107559_c0_g1_i1.p2 TRINITY_DN107559_c0_g1~~TRINITY_DN107559_c0_g1_i1.p2  ORF type:complete len:164 (-),score=51.35 TRINITY_DN107559_c0_g1_i1:13-504(-)
MALITGGLGGLGVLATYELAANGAGFVVTTSRSGRIASGQPELVQLQENLRQYCTHYNAKVDGCDIAALSDLFQYIQRPESQTEDDDLFASAISNVEKNKALMGPADIKKLMATRDHVAETIAMLEKEVAANTRGGSREEWQLRELRKKIAQMNEVIKQAGGE